MKTTKELADLEIETTRGTYRFPCVDLLQNAHALDPITSQNPSLQLINDEYGVLSLTWSEVRSITAHGKPGSSAGVVLWHFSV